MAKRYVHSSESRRQGVAHRAYVLPATLLLLGTFGGLTACESDDESAAVDSSVGVDAAVVMCELSNPPSDLPALTGDFAIYLTGGADAGTDAGAADDAGADGDAGADVDAGAADDAGAAMMDAGSAELNPVPIPVGTGGDPTGTWVVERVQFIYPINLAAFIDIPSGMVRGEAWFRFGADGSYATSSDLTLNLIAQTVPTERTILTQATGTFIVDGSAITTTTTCDTGSTDLLTFAQSGDMITFIARQEPSLELGGAVIYVVTQARRAN